MFSGLGRLRRSSRWNALRGVGVVVVVVNVCFRIGEREEVRDVCRRVRSGNIEPLYGRREEILCFRFMIQ